MSLKPASCAVIPQVTGTLVSCGRESGMVINMGHGTTEVISVHGGAPAASRYQRRPTL